MPLTKGSQDSKLNEQDNMKRHTPFRPEFVLTVVNVVAVSLMVTIFVELHTLLATFTDAIWVHVLTVGVEMFIIFEISWRYTCRFIPDHIKHDAEKTSAGMRNSLHIISEQIRKSSLLQTVDAQHAENMQTSVEHTQIIDRLQNLLEEILCSLESIENDLDICKDVHKQNHSAFKSYATLKE